MTRYRSKRDRLRTQRREAERDTRRAGPGVADLPVRGYARRTWTRQQEQKAFREQRLAAAEAKRGRRRQRNLELQRHQRTRDAFREFGRAGAVLNHELAKP